jgi:hypothetical protein
MSDINVRSESVDVEQIMRQIRARIREKRGADYTEAELQQLATVKLEKFLDPRGLRSDLVQHFRQKHVASPAPPNYEFEAGTLYDTHRGVLRMFRSLFKPLLKLFFNPDRITTALHLQAQINTQAEDRLRRLEEREMLSYELLHNMTLEITRLSIEVHNLKMRVESLSSRVDFDERRAKALEGVVQYRTPSPRQAPQQNSPRTAPPAAAPQAQADSVSTETATEGPAASLQVTGDATATGDRRRRRRRRRRRPGGTMADAQGQTWADNSTDEGSDGNEDGGGADEPDPQGSPEQ